MPRATQRSRSQLPGSPRRSSNHTILDWIQPQKRRIRRQLSDPFTPCLRCKTREIQSMQQLNRQELKDRRANALRKTKGRVIPVQWNPKTRSLRTQLHSPPAQLNYPSKAIRPCRGCSKSSYWISIQMARLANHRIKRTSWIFRSRCW